MVITSLNSTLLYSRVRSFPKIVKNGDRLPDTTAYTLILIIVLAIFSTACLRRTPIQGPFFPENSDYIDLKPTWRLRVVTPILKRGGLGQFLAEGKPGADCIGYETTYYAIVRGRSSDLVLEPGVSTVTKNGITTKQKSPLQYQLQLPLGINYLRLVYMVRLSKNDHDVVIVGSRSEPELEKLTRDIVTKAIAECGESPEYCCIWIPKGISVRPEIAQGPIWKRRWVDAR